MDNIARKRKADDLEEDEDHHETSRKQQVTNADVTIKETTQDSTPSPDEGARTEQQVDNKPSAKSEPPDRREPVVPFDNLVLLHVEATCDENSTNPAAIQVSKENAEIIELSFAVLEVAEMRVKHKRRILVRPERTPLTSFCSQITNITWDQLETAASLKEAIQELDQYIRQELNENERKNFCFVTHGGWVMRIQLPREARDKGFMLPDYLASYRMFDLKQEIQRWQMHHPDVTLRSASLAELCEVFQVPRAENEGSKGLDACMTVANIVRHLTSFRHPDVFVYPIDYGADLAQFNKEESSVIHLAGLPSEVTQGELEAWFSSNGLRPLTTWMLQPPMDHHQSSTSSSVSGFVVFQSHGDAVRALDLNGRCFGERLIEASPSSERVIEIAGNILVSFPVQANSRPYSRPGDWKCTQCGFLNYASRLICYKCDAESPNPPPAGLMFGGDWFCPNPNCRFRNYSTRTHCMKCFVQRPSQHPPTSTATTPRTPHPINASLSLPLRPGDWYCPNPSCGFANFASRPECFRCCTPNPNGSPHHHSHSYQDSAYASYSSGYPTKYRPGDWFCNTCSAHNFASRYQCVKCNAAKPHQDQQLSPSPTYQSASSPTKVTTQSEHNGQ